MKATNTLLLIYIALIGGSVLISSRSSIQNQKGKDFEQANVKMIVKDNNKTSNEIGQRGFTTKTSPALKANHDSDLDKVTK